MQTQKHKKYDYMSKMVIVGDAAVGKTNILLRLTEDHFRLGHNSTIGVDFKIKNMQVQDKKIKFTIWDTAGQDRFRTITSNYYRGSDGVIFTYSVSDRNSFHNIQNWISSVEQNTQKQICKMILANKCDLLQSQRQVTTQQGQILASKLNIPFLQVSAKQNIQINEAFYEIALSIKQEIETKNSASTVKSSRMLSIQSSRVKKSLRQNCC